MLYQDTSHVIVTSGRFKLHFKPKLFTIQNIHSKSIHVNRLVPNICCVTFRYSLDWFNGDFISKEYLSRALLRCTTWKLSIGSIGNQQRFTSIRIADMPCLSFLCRFEAHIRVCRWTRGYGIIDRVIGHPNYKAWRPYRSSRHTIECWILGAGKFRSKVVVQYSVISEHQLKIESAELWVHEHRK